MNRSCTNITQGGIPASEEQKSQAGSTTRDATIIGAVPLAMDAFIYLIMFQMKEQSKPGVVEKAGALDLLQLERSSLCYGAVNLNVGPTVHKLHS